MVDSTSDARVVNNVVRHEYRVLTDDEKAQMQEIKDMGRSFIEYCQSIHAGSREISIAITKMEEAVMWAVKHVTK